MADTYTTPTSLGFCTKALHVHITRDISVMSFIIYIELKKETNYTTVIYSVQIQFTTANRIFLNFVKENFKM